MEFQLNQLRIPHLSSHPLRKTPKLWFWKKPNEIPLEISNQNPEIPIETNEKEEIVNINNKTENSQTSESDDKGAGNGNIWKIHIK